MPPTTRNKKNSAAGAKPYDRPPPRDMPEDDKPGFLSRLHPKTHPADVQDYLAQLTDANPRGPYIYPKSIAWRDRAIKVNWRDSLPDGEWEARDTLSNIFTVTKAQKCLQLYLFIVPSKNWVGLKAEKWDKIVWHAYVIALAESAVDKGKHLILWDCDPVKNPKRTKDLKCGQAGVIAEIRKKYNITSIRYCMNREDSGKGACLRVAMERIWRLSNCQDGYFEDMEELSEDCVTLRA